MSRDTNMTQAEFAARTQKIAKLFKKKQEILKAQSLLNFKQAQVDNPIKPKPRKKRGRKRR